MKGISSNTKLILLQPSVHKQGSGSAAASLAAFGSSHRLWLIAFISFFTFATLLTLITTTAGVSHPSSSSSAVALGSSSSSYRSTPLPHHVFDALLHYAISSNFSGTMSEADLRAIAAVLRRRGPCNLLVFGMGPETPLWRSLNAGGRTVFLDENEYYIARLEERHPGLEAYEVGYTTRVSELRDLLAAARAAVRGDCRPVQNLLFSDCRLGINDLPNALYDVAWDVVLVDGPRGYSPVSPGRMSAIFTAAVMARYRNAGPTEVLVHDYEREAERVCSEEFLCGENRVAAAGQLAHFVLRSGGEAAGGGFCANRSAKSAARL